MTPSRPHEIRRRSRFQAQAGAGQRHQEGDVDAAVPRRRSEYAEAFEDVDDGEEENRVAVGVVEDLPDQTAAVSVALVVIREQLLRAGEERRDLKSGHHENGDAQVAMGVIDDARAQGAQSQSQRPSDGAHRIAQHLQPHMGMEPGRVCARHSLHVTGGHGAKEEEKPP